MNNERINYKDIVDVFVGQEKSDASDKTNSDEFVYYGDFMGKPRMVKSDAWKKRSCVIRYWGIKDSVNSQANGFVLGNCFFVVFVLPMPSSWSKKKKEKMNNSLHQSKPDASNLLKSIEDILLVDDSKISFPVTLKVWGYEQKVYIRNLSEKQMTDILYNLCYNIIKG